MERITASPTKLRDGSWGLRVPAGTEPGTVVQVTTRSGKSWLARTGKVLWEGDGVALCTTARASRSLGGDSHGMCESCGEHRAVTTATDGSGITGRVCGLCARDPMSVSFG